MSALELEEAVERVERLAQQGSDTHPLKLALRRVLDALREAQELLQFCARVSRGMPVTDEQAEMAESVIGPLRAKLADAQANLPCGHHSSQDCGEVREVLADSERPCSPCGDGDMCRLYGAAADGGEQVTDSKLDAKLEEIRDRLLRRLYPCDFTSVKDYDKVRALTEAALREAVEAAVAQEREAFRDVVRQEGGMDRNYYGDELQSSLFAWLDARSRAEKSK